MTLNEVLKNTNYDVSLFSEEARIFIEEAIVVKTVRGKETPFITCLKRGKEIVLKPEEAVRQLYLYKLIHEYGYPTSRIEVEFPIHFGREVKRADIAIMDKDRPMVPYIIVELKKPKLSDGKEQLKSYCNATGAPIGVWTNGEQISYYNRKDPNYFEPITNIPKVYTFKDIPPDKSDCLIIGLKLNRNRGTKWQFIISGFARFFGKYYEEYNGNESLRQNSVLWFLDFVYRLRNALFHEIIDPLDEEWQVIFKNAYLVLKEIVDLNIATIDITGQTV